MGILTTLLFFVIFVVIFTYVFTQYSNYLDSHVNPTLNVARFLKLDEIDTSTDDKRIATNRKILPHMSIMSKLKLINHEASPSVSTKRTKIFSSGSAEKGDM